ncbi:MAG: hypothetical protein GC205_06540 [Bacteroidetes bacterium]|nr:hypothetical protein [Bacteroidota bacterium]
MYRYAFFMLAFALTLASCSKKEDVGPIRDPYPYLKATVDPGAVPAPEQRSAGSNPYHRYGRLHNQGFKDVILSTNPSTTYKQLINIMGEYTGYPGMETFREFTGLSGLPIEQQLDSAEAAGAGELARATWQFLAEELQAMDTPDFAAANALFNATDAALLGFDPDERSGSLEHALGVSSIFRYSFALHTGATFDGVDYSNQPWNPTPNLPPHPETGVYIDWIQLIMADAMGFLAGFDWKKGLAASLSDLADQLIGGTWTLSEVFYPEIGATAPFSPDAAGSGVMPDR